MRVTKEPEVRKQEILDTALKLFGENGYEKKAKTPAFQRTFFPSTQPQHWLQQR